MPLRNYMRRYAKDKTPNIKPVERIELPEKHLKLRIILTVVFLLIAAVAIGFGVKSCLSAEKGWQTITVSNAANSLSGEFMLVYNIGESGKDVTSEKKAVQYAYTASAQEAYKLYDNYAPEGYMLKINGSDGESVEVDPELYSAFQKMLEYGGRMLYYTPYFEYYEQVFGAESDFEASMYDPDENKEIKELFQKLSVYINDDNAISLKLLGNNSVSLKVSDGYRAFAKENGIDNFIGFGWLKNAFAADLMASRMKAGGYSNGYLTSVDGFTEYLNGRGYDYSVILYDHSDNTLTAACRLNVEKAQSSVYFKNFMISTKENGYIYNNGRIVTPFTDENGEQRCASSVMYVYSKSSGCADAALQTAAIYVSDSINESKLISLKSTGTYAIYIKDGSIRYTEEALQIADVDGRYKTEYVK